MDPRRCRRQDLCIGHLGAHVREARRVPFRRTLWEEGSAGRSRRLPRIEVAVGFQEETSCVSARVLVVGVVAALSTREAWIAEQSTFDPVNHWHTPIAGFDPHDCAAPG